MATIVMSGLPMIITQVFPRSSKQNASFSMVQRIYNSKEWQNEGTNSTDPFCILFDTSIID
jgi:uncharacterized protein YceK